MLLESNQLEDDSRAKTLGKSPLSTRVILVRHGESTYNALGLHQGSSDESVLTETGLYCAGQTGAFLKGLTLDALYSSSLKRARQTAKEILAVMGLAREELMVADYSPQLREVDLPAWQGLQHQYVREQLAEDYRCWKQRPHEFRMALPQKPQSTQQQYCYPVLDLYDRLQQFWQQILPRHLGQTLLLVGHSGTNRAAIATAIGLTPDRYHAFQQSNCGISVLNFPLGCLQKGKLEAMNITTHLGKPLPQPKGETEGLRLLLIPTAGKMSLSQTQKLAEALREVPIDFSISGDLAQSEAAKQILQSHRGTVQLQVLREDFLQAWQQAIELKGLTTESASERSGKLITGIVVAPHGIIQRFIGQILGMSEELLGNLPLSPGTISVIHYPKRGAQPPMLQAMNILVPEQQLSFGGVATAAPLFVANSVGSNSVGS